MVVLAKKAKDTYLELINRLPLVRIKDDEHLDFASQVVDELLQMNLDSGGESYLEVLSDLIADYEDEHHEIDAAKPGDVLKSLMDARSLTQVALREEIGFGKSQLSQYVSGNRQISKDAAKTLAEYFGVDVSLFI